MPRLLSHAASVRVSLPAGHLGTVRAVAGPCINVSGAVKGWVGFQLGLRGQELSYRVSRVSGCGGGRMGKAGSAEGCGLEQKSRQMWVVISNPMVSLLHLFHLPSMVSPELREPPLLQGVLKAPNIPSKVISGRLTSSCRIPHTIGIPCFSIWCFQTDTVEPRPGCTMGQSRSDGARQWLGPPGKRGRAAGEFTAARVSGEHRPRTPSLLGLSCSARLYPLEIQHW